MCLGKTAQRNEWIVCLKPAGAGATTNNEPAGITRPAFAAKVALAAVLGEKTPVKRLRPRSM
jgi:hypothetical protein